MKKELFAFAALAACLSAHAQLTSVDGGAAVIDGNGLMWANTVGLDLSWSPTDQPGSAQAWIAGLNAGNYGGFNDWTLATGDGNVGANTTTNELGDLFYSDCGNAPGTPTALSNPGKNCTAFSALKNPISKAYPLTGMNTVLVLSATADPAFNDPQQPQYGFWAYELDNSTQRGSGTDIVVDGVVGLGDSLAVRAAPEIDPTSAASGLALLFGSLAILRGRRKTLLSPHVPREGT